MSDIGICGLCNEYIPYGYLEQHFREKHDLSPEQMHEGTNELLIRGYDTAKKILTTYPLFDIHAALPYLIAALIRYKEKEGVDQKIMLHGLIELTETLLEAGE